MEFRGLISELRCDVSVVRFSDAGACADDYFVTEGGYNVQHFPDPERGTWGENEDPRRGYSCFSLEKASSLSSPKCSVLNCGTLPNGWRLRYTHDLSFLSTTGEVAHARHYLLYSSVPKSIVEFVDGIDELPWTECGADRDDLAFVLCDSDDAEMEQPVNANVDAVRMSECMIKSTDLNDLECFLLACTHCELAVDMRPLRYHALPLLEKTLHIVRRHEAPRGHFLLMYEYHEALCAYLEAAIRWKGFEPDRDVRADVDADALSGFFSEEDDMVDEKDEGGEEEVGHATVSGDAVTPLASRSSVMEQTPSTGTSSVPSTEPVPADSLLGRRLFSAVH